MSWFPIETAPEKMRLLFASPVGVISGKRIAGKPACSGEDYKYMPVTHWMFPPDLPPESDA